MVTNDSGRQSSASPLDDHGGDKGISHNARIWDELMNKLQRVLSGIELIILENEPDTPRRLIDLSTSADELSAIICTAVKPIIFPKEPVTVISDYNNIEPLSSQGK